MNSLNNVNLHLLIDIANELTQQEGVTRIINSFGAWSVDNNKQPTTFQVDVTIKEIGGEHTRTERGFYFVPTTIPHHALAIAKAMATLDFFNSKYPILEEKVEHRSQTENEVSEEGQPEVSVPEDKAESVDPEPPKKTRKPRTTKPKPEVAEVAEKVEVKREAYDNTIPAHKDALIAYLDRHHQGWRDMGKDKTKAMSAALVGKPFLHDDGAICEKFKDLLAEHING